jgi:sialate O-acetylesterase
MLQSFWGGSRIEAWTSREALAVEPALRGILDWWTAAFAKFNPGKSKADYREELSRWRAATASAKAKGSKPPKKPTAPADPRTSRHRPACLYNGMIAPLIPYGIRGVISYQGLGNLFWAQYSHVLMPTMIRDWRIQWGQGDFPFGMVQPAPYPCDRWPKSSPDAYAQLRESQLLLLDRVPNTGVAPTMDIGDLKNLHFTNKQDVGRRMAAWALATVYGRTVAYSGPVYKSMAVEGDKIRIRFYHADSGLSTKDGKPPTHFTIAGRDMAFHPATATIDGNTVVVMSEKVAEPIAVRFAWSDTAVPNLFNREGLPASLFRTDHPPVHSDGTRRVSPSQPTPPRSP